MAFPASWQTPMAIWEMEIPTLDRISGPVLCLYSEWPGPDASVEFARKPIMDNY